MVIKTLPNRAELVQFPGILIDRQGLSGDFNPALNAGSLWLSEGYFGLDRGISILKIQMSLAVENAAQCPFIVMRAAPYCHARGAAPASSKALTRHIHDRNDVLAPDVVDRSVLIVVVVIGVISVAAMIAPVIGHRVSDCRAPDATHDRADRTANNSPGNSAPNPSGDRAAFVGKGDLR